MKNLERLQEEKDSLNETCNRLKEMLVAKEQRAEADIAYLELRFKNEQEMNRVSEEKLQRHIRTLHEMRDGDKRSLNEKIRVNKINLLESNRKCRTLEASLEREKNERKADLETQCMEVRDLKQDHAQDKRQMLSEMEAKKQELARLQKSMEYLYDESRMQKGVNDGLLRQTQE